MTVCSETPCAISTLEQLGTRLGTPELIDLDVSNVFLNGCARASTISVERRRRKGLVRYSDCTEPLLGLFRTSTDAKVATTSAPTGQPAAGGVL
jgi:hypothetical protein